MEMGLDLPVSVQLHSYLAVKLYTPIEISGNRPGDVTVYHVRAGDI